MVQSVDVETDTQSMIPTVASVEEPCPTYGYSYIETFQCLAADCPDNCCKNNWTIGVPERTYQHYRQHLPHLCDLIVKEEQHYRMKRDDQGCVAMDAGLCSIHRDYGEGTLSETCINFPRMYRHVNGFYTRAGTMGCPEIVRQCLFDADPFALVETELPSHHQGGEGIPSIPVEGLSHATWHDVMTSLLAMVLDDALTIEHILFALINISPSFAEKSYDEWPDAIRAQHQLRLKHVDMTPEALCEQVLGQSVSDEEKMAQATRMLMMVLEHLDQPRMPESIRQGVASAFEVISRDADNQIQCRILPVYQAYATLYGRQWLDPILKRFVAAEITRYGFPFLSKTTSGMDYGQTFAEITTTLCLRVLSVRMYLIINAVNGMSDAQRVPTEAMVVDWVYRICRHLNHQATGGHELALRQQVLEKTLVMGLTPFLDFQNL